VSRSTWDTSKSCSDFAYGPITLYGGSFQILLLSSQVLYRGPATPSCKQDGLGCSPFARHYWGNHYCVLFLRVLRCFTSPGFAFRPYCIQAGISRYEAGRVAPFGNLRIKACLPLPEAYRSLPRPSSPTDAKAFTMRPLQLDQKYFGQFFNSIYFNTFFGEELYLPFLCNCQRTTPVFHGEMVLVE
jgi:hypothetical protein